MANESGCVTSGGRALNELIQDLIDDINDQLCDLLPEARQLESVSPAKE